MHFQQIALIRPTQIGADEGIFPQITQIKATQIGADECKHEAVTCLRESACIKSAIICGKN